MGYTHYWRHQRNITKKDWPEVRDDLAQILKVAEHEAGIALAGPHGEGGTRPEVTDNWVSFNGLGEDACETMFIDRVIPPRDYPGQERGYGFCKTYERPYDLAVTAVLCYISSIVASHYVTSDGYGQDFLAGLDLARKALPRYANRLDLPMGVMEDDRWCRPWPNHYTEKYRFNFCVDGYAYVRCLKTGAAYRFDDAKDAATFFQRYKDVLDPTGMIDQRRRKALMTHQTRLLRDLVQNAAAFDRAHRPPAYVRPGTMPTPGEAGKSLTELLSL